MMKHPIHQKDLAQMLNVSVMTVSKALRDHPDISPETRDKIKALAQKVGYRPNLVARNLAVQRTFTLGVVLPRIAHSFYSCILDGIYKEASNRTYQVILAVSQENHLIEMESIQNLLAMRVDGLLVSLSQSTRNLQIFETVKHARVPLVFFDRAPDLPLFSSVTTDNYGGAFAAIDYAARAGYTRIAHIGGPEHLDLSRKRRDGCLDALRQHNLPIRSEWIVESRFGEPGGVEGFQRLWRLPEKPELIFTASDSIAIGVYKAAREIGLHIPQDISVIGFSDIEFVQLLSPALTTVHEPAEELGHQAAALLIEEINESKNQPVQQIIKTELKIRQSCRAIPRMETTNEKTVPRKGVSLEQ